MDNLNGWFEAKFDKQNFYTNLSVHTLFTIYLILQNCIIHKIIWGGAGVNKFGDGKCFLTGYAFPGLVSERVKDITFLHYITLCLVFKGHIRFCTLPEWIYVSLL